MQVIRGLHNIPARKECAVTIGTFDGVHLGHIKIIDTLIKKARSRNLCATLVTFDPHPKLVVGPANRNEVHILTTLQEKIEILQRTGLDRMVVVTFDRKLASTNYEDFVHSVLIEKLGAQAIVIGYDHAFGKNREGNFENLKKLSARYPFDLQQVGPYQIEGLTVSSTELRKLIHGGQVRQAARFLGRFYQLTGKVVHGDDRGKALSFPTANIQVSNGNKMIPANGVYAVDINYRGDVYKGMMNIGFKPTFNRPGIRNVEVHIFDFDAEIYEQHITVLFKKRLRDEKKFDSREALIAQLEIDRQNSLKI